MKTTYKKVRQFMIAAARYLADPEHKGDTKFNYALKRMQARCQDVMQEHEDELERERITHAATHPETKIILRNAQGGYEYDKENLLALQEKEIALRNKEVEIQPYNATEMPPKPLTPEEEEVFEGFVFERKG